MFRGPGLTAAQELANACVAPLRTVLVENVFAGLLNLWGKLSKKRAMQLKKKQVAKTIRVAVLLRTHARACMDRRPALTSNARGPLCRSIFTMHNTWIFYDATERRHLSPPAH